MKNNTLNFPENIIEIKEGSFDIDNIEKLDLSNYKMLKNNWRKCF